MADPQLLAMFPNLNKKDINDELMRCGGKGRIECRVLYSQTLTLDTRSVKRLCFLSLRLRIVLNFLS